MRSDGTGVEVDYDEPGSPLDRYLANLDLEFHPAAGTEELSLAQQLHNVQAESPEQTSAAIKEDLSQIEQDLSPIMFAKNLCSKMRRGAAEYLQGLKDNHLIKASKLEYDSRTFLQQQLADFQLDDALEVLNNELDRAHVLSTKEITRSPFPKYAGHIFAVYLALIIKNAHSFPIWINVIHFCLAVGGLLFLFSWLRYYLIYWSFHDNVKENLKQVEDMKETFDLMDRALQRSLRFIRDMQVLNKGFTTVKSPTSSQENNHRCPRDVHLMKSYVKSCLTFVCERLDPETPLNLTSIDSELEMLIIEYHERRSVCIRKSASQLLKDSLFFRSVSIQDEIRLLEQQTDRIRRLDLEPRPENQDATSNPVPNDKLAVLRSLAIHAQLLAREAYQETCPDMEIASMENLSRHATGVTEAFALLLSVSAQKEHDVTSQDDAVKPTTSSDSQTSFLLNAEAEQLDQIDVVDDIIFEETVVHDDNEDESRTLNRMIADDDPLEKLGAKNVISELKNILPKTVNQNSRQTRKEALFPDYWRENTPRPSDIIIPSTESLSLHGSENTTESQKSSTSNAFEDSRRTQILEIGQSGCEEPDYRSQIEKDLDDGRRDHLTENHDYCCPSSSSLASILAQQVAKKSAKIEAEEFSYGD